MQLPCSNGHCHIGSAGIYFAHIFRYLDNSTAKVMLPLSGFFISLFIGWYLDRKITFAQLTNDGKLPMSVRFLQSYVFILKYIAPVAIVLIFIYGILF